MELLFFIVNTVAFHCATLQVWPATSRVLLSLRCIACSILLFERGDDDDASSSRPPPPPPPIDSILLLCLRGGVRVRYGIRDGIRDGVRVGCLHIINWQRTQQLYVYIVLSIELLM